MIVQHEEILPSPETIILTGTPGVVEIRSGDAVCLPHRGVRAVVEPGIKEEIGLDLGLAGRVALVAASSKGLGRVLANGLAAEGAKVMIFGRDEASLKDTTGEIREATNAEVDHQRADLTRAEDIRALVERTAERFRGLDVLIITVGGPPTGTFDAVWDED